MLRRLLDALVVGDAAVATACVVDDVTGWSPNLMVTSRDQLLIAQLLIDP